jgi:hypothetical protein
MAYQHYLKLGRVERFTMHIELCDMIEEANVKPEDEDVEGGGGAIRPKKLRR